MSATKLEIDDDIIKKQLLINEPTNELDTLFPSNTSFSSAIVKPKPGICVKTKNTSTGEKVFINVCTSDAIPAPEDLSNDELISIFESDAPSDFKIPMSIGVPHQETDKGGSPCTAYDVIINPSFLDKMTDNPLFHNFFMVVTIEGLDSKYDVALDKNSWIELKNKKYHGALPEQTIRTSIPLIQELSGVKEWRAKDFPSNQNEENEGKLSLISEVATKMIENVHQEKAKPTVSFQKKCRDSNTFLRAEIHLPEQVCAQGIKVSIGEDRVVVESERYFLDECLPYSINAASSQAFFAKSQRFLVLLISLMET